MKTSRLTGLIDAIGRLRRPGPRVQKLALAAGLLGFVLVVTWGVRGYSRADLEPDLTWLVVAALVGTPVALILNGIELRIIASGVDADLSRRDLVTATLFASAANALPVPGSVLVRGWSLSARGVALAEIVKVQAVAGVTFVSVALLITGLVAMATSLAGVVLAAIGGAGLLVISRAGRRYPISRLATVEAAMVVSELGRYALVLAALGVDVTVARSSGLVLANVVSTATGVFPAGLGLREVLAGLIARTTDLASAVAVTASALDRVATSVVLGGLVLLAVAGGVHRDFGAHADPAEPT